MTFAIIGALAFALVGMTMAVSELARGRSNEALICALLGAFLGALIMIAALSLIPPA